MAIGTLAAIGLGLAGAGSVIGGISAGKGAKNAAQAQLAATQSNNALARDIYGQNKEALTPFINAGTPANALLAGAAGYGDTGAYRNAFRNFIDSSDYGFQFGQGANKLNSGYAGAGVLQSGAAMKGLEDYRQGLQSGYRGEFNSLLGSQQGVGLTGASALAGIGQNYVNTISANNNAGADAKANAALIKAQNNPFANALSLLGGGIFGMGR